MPRREGRTGPYAIVKMKRPYGRQSFWSYFPAPKRLERLPLKWTRIFVLFEYHPLHKWLFLWARRRMKYMGPNRFAPASVNHPLQCRPLPARSHLTALRAMVKNPSKRELISALKFFSFCSAGFEASLDLEKITHLRTDTNSQSECGYPARE